MSSVTQDKGKTALITGASAGIGKALAEAFAQKGFNLILVARRKEKLQEVADLLGTKYKVKTHVIAADLSKSTSPKKIYDEVQAAGLRVDALVNNAGYALNKAFSKASWKEHQEFLNVMLVSVTQLSHLFIPAMKENRYGRIINVSSVAAFTPEWGGSLYGAVKSYVAHMSEALDLELKPFGIHVTSLHPGFTYSEFHDVMGAAKLRDTLPKWLWMDAETVAQQGVDAVMKGEPACINGWVNRSMVTAFTLMPAKMKYMIAQKQKVL
ncbi:MAG: SDR family oxidoreductase [Hahellaceae bacterium]|nr:SDR family oxidoreductase [Hahellaceae bacterium]MCP5169905.1 SDR family oxidoreductase [Hahellaceae bacterium]